MYIKVQFLFLPSNPFFVGSDTNMSFMLTPQSSKPEGNPEFHSDRLDGEYRTLSYQPRLPSVPSLTLPPHCHESIIVRHHCITTLKGHSSYVSSLAITAEHLYTGSADEEIRSWRRNHSNSNPDDLNTLINNTVSIGKGAVKSLVVLSDKLFSAHQDHKIRVWKINSYEPSYHHHIHTHVATLPTLGDRALHLLIPKNYVQIRRHKTSTWVNHVDTVSALALSRDESLLYSVSWDRTLKIWRTSDFKCLESLWSIHEDAINAVTSSIDGRIYTGSADKKIKAWRKNPGEKRHQLVETLEKHDSGINALAISNDGCTLFSGASDRSILVWERTGLENMRITGALRGHRKSILCLAVVSNLICSGSADKTIRIWSGMGRNYSCLAVLEGHEGPVKCLAGAIDPHNPSNSSSSSSYLLYSGSLDCNIRVWQVSLNKL